MSHHDFSVILNAAFSNMLKWSQLANWTHEQWSRKKNLHWKWEQNPG